MTANDKPKPKFGQRVINLSASPDNPQREGIFVERIYITGRLNHGTWFRVTDGNGSFWMISPDKTEQKPQVIADPKRIREALERNRPKVLDTAQRPDTVRRKNG